MALDDGEVGRVRQEVVIEEHHDIYVPGSRNHRVALSRQARLSLQQPHAGACTLGALDIGSLRAAHDHCVRRPRLQPEFAQGLAQHSSPSDSWDADCNPASH